MYTWRASGNPNGLPIDLIVILHVVDFLIAHTIIGLEYFSQMMKTFETGEICTLKPANPLTYLGINIPMGEDRSIFLSQREFVGRLKLAGRNRFISGNRLILKKEKIRTEFRSILGNLIWVLQTQFSASFLITKFATSTAYHCESPEDVALTISLASKIIRSLQVKPTVLHYAPLFAGIPTFDQLKELKLFSFSDCGFATLHLHRSVESHLIIVGKPLKRDGDISLIGHAIDFGCREIPRTTRSTISGDAVALANAIDSGIFAQSMLVEIFCGIVPSLHINDTDPYPLTTPFQPSPDLVLLRQRIVEGSSSSFIGRAPSIEEWGRGGKAKSNMTIPLSSEQGDNILVSGCRKWHCKTIFFVGTLSRNFSEIAAVKPENGPFNYFRLVSLTDCANIYSAVLSLNPKSVCKLTKINLSFARGCVNSGALSFIDASTNLSDVGTKNSGSLEILNSFFRTGLFKISFVGRQGAKLLQSGKDSFGIS